VSMLSGGFGEVFDVGGGVLETNVVGDEELALKLIELSEYIEDTAAPLRAAKAIAKAEMRNRFQTDTAPDGTPWRPLALETIERKKRSPTLATRPSDILTHTKKMERSAYGEESYQIVDDSLIFTTANLPPYWSVHEYGTGVAETVSFTNPLTGTKIESTIQTGEGRGGATPQRPFIGLGYKGEEQILNVFELWYEHGVDITITPMGFVKEPGRHGKRLFPKFTS